jgi:OPA family glycerol-3-phosphate transporter-like MFS transporter
MLAAACISLVTYFTPSSNGLVAGLLMFFAGFFVYGPQANFWPLSPELLGEKFVGTGIGVMNMCAYLFAALGEPLLGKAIDITKDTSSVFLVISVICVLSAITISFAGKRKETNQNGTLHKNSSP